MKSDKMLLDYLEILLSQTGARCELYVCGGDGGVREKLASAHTRALVAHLRAAELHIARGESVIRLEPHSRLRDNCTWFTRATLERFVQFVRTPEVLERVKIVGDELTQLEQVRIALFKTFSQDGAQFTPPSADVLSPAELHQERGNMMMGSGLPDDAKSSAETSKRELLRAMDVRLAAVNQELYMAFCRAVSAGFDKSTVCDLMDFSQQFGAQRLWDSCLQFVGLSKRMNSFRQLDEDCDSQTVDDASTDSEMSLESGTDTGIATETDDCASWTSRVFDSSSNVQFDRLPESRSPIIKWDSNADSPGEISTFACGTPARVRSRWGPPERIRIYSLESEVQDYEIPTKASKVEQNANGVCQQSISNSDSGDQEIHLDEHFSLTRKEHIKLTSPLQKQHHDKNNDIVGNRGTFFCHLQKMAQQVEARRLSTDMGIHFTSVGISNGLQDFEVVKSPNLADSVCSSEDGHSAAVSDYSEERAVVGPPSQITEESQSSGGNLRRSEKNLRSGIGEQDEVPTGGRAEQDEHISTSSRRLSVQAAISLFESKKANGISPVANKLVRQDSQNGPTLKKSAVRRWSGIGPENSAILDEASFKDPTVILKPSDMGRNNQEQILADNNSTLASKRALSTWPHHTNIHQSGTCSEALIPEHQPLTQQWSPPHAQFAEGLQKQFKLELEKSLARNNRNYTHVDANASKSITGSSQVSDSSSTRFSKKQIPEIPLSKLVNSVPKASDVITDCASKDQVSETAQWNCTSMLNLTSKRDPKAQISAAHPKKSLGSLNSSNSAETLVGDQALSIMKSFQTDQTPELQYVMETPKDSLTFRRATHETTNMESGKGTTAHEGKLVMQQNRKPMHGKLLISETTSARLKEDKVINSVTISSKKEYSMKEPNIKLKKEIDGTGKTGHKLSSSEAQHKIIRRNPPTLQDAPIDLHMQALVMMIDNNHQSSINSGNESCNEQEGRHYEHYQKLRDARQQKENPAKRAEREIKLKYMKETLDRRKSEMENGSLGPANKLPKEKIIKVGNVLPKTTSTETPKQQKALEEDNEVIHRDRRLSYITSMAPKSHMNMSPTVQTSKRGLSALPNSSKAPFSSMNASSAFSLRAVPNSSAVGRRRSTHSGSMENPISQKITEVKKDMWKSFASSKVPRAVSGESISPDSFSGLKDEEMKRSTSLRRKECISMTAGKTSSPALNIALVTGPESMINNTRSSEVHGMKSLFNRKEGMSSIMQRDTRKHETPTSLRKNFDEEISSPNIYAHDYRKAGRKEESRKPFESRNVNSSGQHTFSVASISLDNEDEEEDADGTEDGTDVDEASDIFVDACSDERVLSIDDD